MNKLIVSFFIIFSLLAFAGSKGSKVAVVKMKRGNVEVIMPDGSMKKVKKGDWIEEGSVIKTAPRSFCKLSFIDKSSMNVGPKSEMKIEKFDKKDAGVINVISGKIRSQVTKDYLDMDKGKSKLFIKSKSAVMGIRGTDFMFAANKRTGATTAVLFEGSVVFNKINKGDNLRNLESIVNKGRRINPGQFSVVNNNFRKPTVPAKMSTGQLKALNKNKNFADRAPVNPEKMKIKKSIVPPGLTGDVVASDGAGLKSDLKKVARVKVKERANKIDKKQMQQTKGFIQGQDVKPADGAIVHVDSGTIIPLGSDSKFDNNTQEWVSSSVGGVDVAGNYIPPEGFKMTEDGQMLKLDQNTGKTMEVVLEVKPVDQLPPMDKMQVIEFNPQQPIEGPAPAGQNEPTDNFDRDANSLFNGNCEGECLPPPPICDGCSIRPPTFFNGTPGELGPANRPTTPTTIRVIKQQ
jgi:hypothetical protein